ncbi:MAG: GNAT family N-acyltransferase [Bacilli bacterium]|nr:GNAT family N-acetyltransferase [Bacilli bacterium]
MAKITPIECGNFIVKIADTEEELEQLFKLRYEELFLYYNKEIKQDEEMCIDRYDYLCDHLICYDTLNKQVAGTYRLVLEDHIRTVGSFITESEYDISKIKSKKILELGRAVVKEEYRTGAVIKLLWRGLVKYAQVNNINYMFGTGSFQGIDPSSYDQALSYIYYNHLSPQDVRVQARLESRSNINLIKEHEIDLRKVREQMPALIKGYIKIGATFGEDAYIDVPFNSVDVFVLLDVDKVNPDILRRFQN